MKQEVGGAQGKVGTNVLTWKHEKQNMMAREHEGICTVKNEFAREIVQRRVALKCLKNFRKQFLKPESLTAPPL